MDEAATSAASLEEGIRQLLSNPLVTKAVIVLVVAIVLLIIGRIGRRTLRRYVTDGSARYKARKLITFGTWTLIAIFIAGTFSNQLGTLTVAFGVAGAGIAFALQEVIVSFAGWIALSFGGIYKTGDRIRLGGVRGDVIDITPTRTTLMECGEWVAGDLYSGRVVRISNSFIFKDPVFNYSGDFPFLWDELTVPIRHESDLAQARKLLEEAAMSTVGHYVESAGKTMDHLVSKYLVERARVEPMVTMVADENWVTFTVRYVVDYKARRGSKDRLFTHILRRINESHGAVQIATAAQEITVHRASQLSVNLDSHAKA